MAPYQDFYQAGVPATIETPTDSLVELIEQAVASGGDTVAVQFFGKTISYRQLGERIDRAAEGLRRLGVQAGDRVALVLPNCPQHVIAFYAILRLGAIVVEHNPLYTARELRHLFEDHAARVVIAWDIAIDRLRQQPGDIAIETIIAVRLTDEFSWTKRLGLRLPLPPLRRLRRRLTTPVKGVVTWKDLLHHRPIKAHHPKPSVADTAVIIYTSGTSGVPKGAMLSHGNLYANARQGDAWMHDAVRGAETVYAVLPFFHALGLTVGLTYALMINAKLVIFPTFDRPSIIKELKRTPPTILAAVPPIFEALAADCKHHRIKLTGTRICLSGAMSLSEEIRAAWQKTGAGPLVEGYGLTEASPIALGNPFAASRKPGTIGLPFPSTVIKLVDVDDASKEVAPGLPGELLIAGPQVFAGYWHNPNETAQVLLPGGWLATGDIVTQDADGFVTIVGRKKDLIITGGFNVAPAEVEQVILTHAAVVDVAVVGLPHAHSGEEVVAAVVVAPGERLDVKELRAYCRARLAAYKVPRQLRLVESLPKTMLGKIRHAEVRQLLLAGSSRRSK
ncbi:MAG: AMP-binding protein [Propionibacteriaceae bacterium]|jgi:long-chain acyl-CoA synthetase|nr:AMP-binding protein [Propionibacteriaceae bacterium]